VPEIYSPPATDNLRHDLIDAKEPALLAGSYTIKVSETLTGPSDAPVPFTATRQVEVRAPRYQLDPAEVHSVFPSPSSTGDFTLVFPHITLTRAVLPWERTLAGAARDARRAPWMALMVLSDEQIVGTGRQPVPTVTARLGLGPEAAEPREESECETVTVAWDTLQQVFPRREDLSHLAHVRRWQRPAQGRYARAADQPDGPGENAVVIGNRLPLRGGEFTAFLVSLEGLEALLDDLDNPDATHGPITFVALWSWGFTSTDSTGRGFPALMAPIARDNNKLFRLEPGGGAASGGIAAAQARQFLDEGYVPMQQHLESGSETLALYRGPFAPLPVPQDEDPSRYVTALPGLVYVQAYGVLEAGRASAWGLGRALAVADAAFCAALLRWRRNQSLNQAQSDQREGQPGLVEAFRTLLTANGGLGYQLGLALDPHLGLPALAAATPRTRAGEVPAGPDEDEALIRSWLSALRRFETVPFRALVPDARMTPEESIRFFHIDPLWLIALISGALSVGVARDYDIASLDTGLFDYFATGQGEPAPGSGLLLRSRLVADYPDLEVKLRYQDSWEGPLAFRRVAPDTLLCLFRDTPDEVAVSQPPQTLHFGLDINEEADPGATGLEKAAVNLRRTTDTGEGLGTATGEQFRDVAAAARNGELGTLNMLQLATRLNDLISPGAGGPLTPAELAMQLLNAPSSQSFSS
jgi:hypothetical protein